MTFFCQLIMEYHSYLSPNTAYQYRNLLGRILLLAKIMIIANHEHHKYKYEFQKNSKCFVKLKYNFFKVVIILYCLYTAKNILMVFFFYLEIFPPKFIFIWKFKKLNKNFFNFFEKFGCYCLLMQLNCPNTSPSPTLGLFLPHLIEFGHNISNLGYIQAIFGHILFCY